VAADEPPLVWILAGHDPSGGAGVDADAEAVQAAGARPVARITAHTDQDAEGVRAVRPRPPAAWGADLAAALDDPRSGAFKFGLLPNAEAVRAAAAWVRRSTERGLPAVVDPVLAPTRGAAFLDDAGIAALLDELLPAGPLLTPNLPELARLSGAALGELESDPERRVAAADELCRRGARAVVVKGGHGLEDPLRELLIRPDLPAVSWERRRLPGPGIRGSGCRFASFLAARLALGDALDQAVPAAGAYLSERIAAAHG
jgi:hydroxymethylpyrimidine/phosphomethylpyrimidine kinase